MIKRFEIFNANLNNAVGQHKYRLMVVHSTPVQRSQLLPSLDMDHAIFSVASWQAQGVLRALPLLDLHLLSHNSLKACQRSLLRLPECPLGPSLVNTHLSLVINQILARMVSCTAMI